MATKRITDQSGIEDGDFIEVKADDISQLEDDIDAELAKVTADFDKDDNDVNLEVRIYKTVPNSTELDYLFTCTPAEFPIVDRVRDEYGGGKYQVRIYREAGGKKSLFRRFSFRIGSPRPFAQHHAPAKSGVDDMANVVRAMAENQQKQMEQFQTMMVNMQRTAQPAQQTSMVDMMQGIAAMMGAMQQLMPKPQPATGGIETLIQGMTLAKDLLGESGGGGSERNLYDTLTETVKTFGPVMAGALSNPSPRAHRRTPDPAMTPGKTPPPPQLPRPKQPANSGTHEQPQNQPAQPSEAERMNAIKMQQLKMYTGMLVQKAQENSDPSLYAELILDNVSDEDLDRFLLGEHGLDNLAKIHGGVDHHRAWFNSLRDEVLALLKENDEGAMLGENGQAAPDDETGSAPTNS